MLSALRTVKRTIVGLLCLLFVGFNIHMAIARSGMTRVKAVVGAVDRSCVFESGTSNADNCGDSAALTSDARLYQDGKRIASVKGSAKVSLVYTAVDGSNRTVVADVAADRDLYYTVKAGDEMSMLVDDKDPPRFIVE